MTKSNMKRRVPGARPPVTRGALMGGVAVGALALAIVAGMARPVQGEEIQELNGYIARDNPDASLSDANVAFDVEVYNSRITLTNVTIGRYIMGGDGSETVILDGTTRLNVSLVLYGGNDTLIFKGNAAMVRGAVNGGDGVDTLILDGKTGTLNSSKYQDWERLIFKNGANMTVDGMAGIRDVTVADSTVVLINATLNSVTGGTGVEVITLGSGVTVAGDVNMGGGDDRLTLAGDVSIAGAIDGGAGADTLIFDNATGQLGVISNWETVVIQNGSNITVGGTADGNADLVGGGVDVGSGGGLPAGISGAETVDGGIGRQIDDYQLGGNLQIGAGSNLLVTGGYIVSGDLVNNGIFNMADASAGDVLNVSGDYCGAGAIVFDLDLAAGTSDRIVIDGAVGCGQAASILVPTLGGQGDAPGGLVSLNIGNIGGQIGDGVFVVGNTKGNAFNYDLTFDKRGNMMLAIAPRTATLNYALAPLMAMGILTDQTGTARERVGHDARRRNIWARGSDTKGTFSPALSGTQYRYQQKSQFIEAGTDITSMSLSKGYGVKAGFFGGLGKSDVTLLDAGGAVNIESKSLGLYGTLLLDKGFLDLQIKRNWLNLDLASLDDNSSVSYGGSIWSVSAEAARSLWLPGLFDIEPQFQVSYSRLNLQDAVDQNDMTVKNARATSLRTRVTVRFSRDFNAGVVVLTPFMQVGMAEEFKGKAVARVSGTRFTGDLSGSTYSVSGGVNVRLVPVGATLYVSGQASFGDVLKNDQTALRVGVNFSF